MAEPGTGLWPAEATTVSFERTPLAGEASRVRGAGAHAADQADSLAAALGQAGEAAIASGAGPPGGLLSGAALEECAALLARRSRDDAEEIGRIAGQMERALELLATADEEGARGVAGAGG